MKVKPKVVGFFARAHGLAALQALIQSERYSIVHVFTHARNPKAEDPLREVRPDFHQFQEVAKARGILLTSIDSAEEAQEIDKVLQQIPDLSFLVSVSWRRKVPKAHLERAQVAAINLHRGSLPEYPGAEPIKQALLKGERDIYITAHRMTEEIDAGELIAKAKHPVRYVETQSLDENISRLKEEITPLFGPLLLTAMTRVSAAETSHAFIDFDGTLVDTLETLYQCFARFLNEHGVLATRNEFESLKGPSLREIVAVLRRRYALSPSEEALQARYAELIQEEFAHSASPFADAEPFLARLKNSGLKLTLVTSNIAPIVLPLLDKWNWRQYFNDYVWGDQVAQSKPHPDIYLQAWRQAGVAKEKIVVIEDSAQGVLAAHRAEMSVLGVLRHGVPQELEDAGARKVFRSLSEALNELK